MRPKRILLIIPNLGFGGAQRVFYDLSVALAKYYTVTECVFNFDNGHAYPSGNEIHSLNVPAGKNFLHKLYCFFLRVYRLKKLKSTLEIDYAISHLEGADYVNILSSGKAKTILYVHGSKKYDQAIVGTIGWWRKKMLIPFLYKRSDGIVTVAKGIATELSGEFSIPTSKIQVVYNGFDLSRIQHLANKEIEGRQYMSIFKKPVLITHGRIVREKNQKLLLDMAVHPLVKDKANLVLIGDGVLFDELVAYARKLGLNTFSCKENLPIQEDQSVFFLGYLPNPFAWLKRSSVFLFPSYFEGLPMALVEAMACGLPAIARDCPYGPKEILNPSNNATQPDGFAEYGILLPATLTQTDELAQWSVAVSRVLTDIELQKKMKQRSLARSGSFSMEVFEKDWMRVLSTM